MEETYCVACGNESDYPRCKECFIKHCEDPTRKRIITGSVGTVKVSSWEIAGGAPSKYCRKCGDDIDENRRRYTVSRGGEAKYCYFCSRF